MMALRTGFITADQLVAGMHRWVDEKNQPLRQIMVKLGFAAEAECDRVAMLLHDLLHIHGKSVHESLKAIAPPPELTSQLEGLRDEDVANSLIRAAEGKVEEHNSPSTVCLPLRPRDRFRVIGPHARGGLGQVSLALDTEINRQVAFKEIREEFADEEMSRRRFVFEAEITGNLEHPGIVPVYSLGFQADGRPYYAMRFIRGVSLDVAISDYHRGIEEAPVVRRASFRRLLQRLLSLCDAVAYAHSRAVLHRDLKPANVMLGEFGETILVDWGLTKLLGDNLRQADSSPQHDPSRSVALDEIAGQGSAIGSPQYMSPEQAEGRPDRHSPQTDIFGLGAILYHILTGKAPIQGQDRESMLENARRANVLPAAVVSETVPAALNAICLKAMSRLPSDRYPSVVEFRDAIQHWLDEEPISSVLATVKYVEGLHAAYPDRLEYEERLGRELLSLSKVMQSLGRLEEAVEVATRATSISERIYRADAANAQRYRELFFARSQHVSLLKAIGREEEAELVELQNRSEFDRLVEASPRTAHVRKELISMTMTLGFSVAEAERLFDAHEKEKEGEHPKTDKQLAETAIVPITGDIAKESSTQPNAVLAAWRRRLTSRYSLQEIIGQGGFATVYRATDHRIGRDVALKILSPGVKHEEMLVREAHVVGALDHPNIPPVYDVGVTKETPTCFFTMKLVRGKSWREELESMPTGRRDRVQLWRRLLAGFVDICFALHLAHQHGVVHADPKPSNVLVDRSDRAWMIDWSTCRVCAPELWPFSLDDELERVLLRPCEKVMLSGHRHTWRRNSSQGSRCSMPAPTSMFSEVVCLRFSRDNFRVAEMLEEPRGRQISSKAYCRRKCSHHEGLIGPYLGVLTMSAFGRPQGILTNDFRRCSNLATPSEAGCEPLRGWREHREQSDSCGGFLALELPCWPVHRRSEVTGNSNSLVGDNMPRRRRNFLAGCGTARLNICVGAENQRHVRLLLGCASWLLSTRSAMHHDFPATTTTVAQITQSVNHCPGRLLQKRQLDDVAQGDFQAARSMLEAMPLPTEQFDLACSRLKNAQHYLRYTEPGAAWYELRLLASSLKNGQSEKREPQRRLRRRA